MNNNLAYRADNRSVDQFAKDIEHGHKVERELVERYAKYVERKHGQKLAIEDNGVDNSGKLLDKASTKADFLLGGMPLEVKFNNRMLRHFHLKVDQLESYIRQKAHILWVNGYEADQMEFTIVSPEQLLEIKKRGTIAFDGWGGKQCYRIAADEFQWKWLY